MMGCAQSSERNPVECIYVGVLDMDSVTQTRVVGTDYHFSLSSLNY